jgi:hypothetical protein
MFKNNNNQSGLSLFLTIIIMAVLLAIVLGLGTIFLGQVVMLREMGYSVIALYAADAGIEKVLTNRENPEPLDGDSETLDNGASYHILVLSPGEEGCQALTFCIKSVGTYKGVSRAVEVNY